MKKTEKGDLFLYSYMQNSANNILYYYVMYMDDRFYYYMDITGVNNELYVSEGQFFHNLEKGNLEFIKNFNIDGMSGEEIKNIIIYSRNIIRESKIDEVLG